METLPIFLFPKLNSYKFAKFLCLKKFLYISVRMLIWAYLEVFEFAEFESGIVLNISISIIGCYLIEPPHLNFQIWHQTWNKRINCSYNLIFITIRWYYLRSWNHHLGIRTWNFQYLTSDSESTNSKYFGYARIPIFNHAWFRLFSRRSTSFLIM